VPDDVDEVSFVVAQLALLATATTAVYHPCITRAAGDGAQQHADRGEADMVEPNGPELAKNPAYRPATEKALETGLFLWSRFVGREPVR
jgi:hypothetical protein